MASPARRERDSQVGFWVKGVYLQVLSFLLCLCPPFFLSNKSFFCVPNDFADKHAAESNFSFVNKESIDNILRAEVFVHNNGQLRTAHLILGY